MIRQQSGLTVSIAALKKKLDFDGQIARILRLRICEQSVQENVSRATFRFLLHFGIKITPEYDISISNLFEDGAPIAVVQQLFSLVIGIW